MDETSQTDYDLIQDTLSSSNNSDVSSTDIKRKGLESLLLKKFIKLPVVMSDIGNIPTDVCVNDSDSDDEPDTLTDEYDDELNVSQLDTSNNLPASKEETNDLKALNDFIRAKSEFNFSNLSDFIVNNPESSDDLIFSQAESDNKAIIRDLSETTKHKYPNLKYKISKSIKSAFKEKYRAFLQDHSSTVQVKSDKSHTMSRSESNSPGNRNVTLKDLKTKSTDFFSESLSLKDSSAPQISSNRHAKKHKPNTQITTPDTKPSDADSINPLKLQRQQHQMSQQQLMLDTDFLRMAATNPLFRFSDFASIASSGNNPYLKNLFQTMPLSTIPQTSPLYPHTHQTSFTPSSSSILSVPRPNSTSSHLTSKPNIYQHSYQSQTNPKTQHTNDINGVLASSNHNSNGSKLKLGNKFSKLSSSEVHTIRSLVNGYKESAAFLNRTAEELEALININYSNHNFE